MFVIFIASYATGLGNIPWSTSELFPLHLRGTGAAILSSGVWAANIFISASFLSIMNGIGAAGAFGFYVSHYRGKACGKCVKVTPKANKTSSGLVWSRALSPAQAGICVVGFVFGKLGDS